MTKNTLLWGRGSVAILALSVALGCQGPLPTVQKTTAPAGAPTAIVGKVDLASLYGTQAGINDIVAAATVSLIDTNLNQTIATGLTDPSGNFTINPSSTFNPKSGETFVLEAVKGLRSNSAQANIARVRTIIRRTGNGYDDIDAGPSIKLSLKTTAIAIAGARTAAELPSFNMGETINKVDASGELVAFEPFSLVELGTYETLTIAALTANQDPVFVAPSPGFVQNYAGSGTASNTDNVVAMSATIWAPSGIAYHEGTTAFYVAAAGSASGDGRLRRINAATGVVSTIGGAVSSIRDVVVSGNRLYILTATSLSYRDLTNLEAPAVTLVTGGTAGTTQLGTDLGAMCADAAGQFIYVADYANDRILRFSTSRPSAAVNLNSTLEGGDVLVAKHANYPNVFSQDGAGGPGGSAAISRPRGIAIVGNTLYVSEYLTHRIRRIDLTQIPAAVATFAGPSGAIEDEGFAHLSTDPNSSNRYYLRMRGNRDGKAGDALFNLPGRLVVDGNKWLYVAEGSHVIRRIALTNPQASNAVQTVAGTYGVTGTTLGAVGTGKFNAPRGMTVVNGRVYVADTGNSRIRFFRGSF